MSCADESPAWRWRERSLRHERSSRRSSRRLRPSPQSLPLRALRRRVTGYRL